MSDEHFTVDGTLIQARASQRAFAAKMYPMTAMARASAARAARTRVMNRLQSLQMPVACSPLFSLLKILIRSPMEADTLVV